MDQNITLRDFLKEMLEPIIDDCVNHAMIKYKNGSPPESPDDPDAFDITAAAKYLLLSKFTMYGLVSKRAIIHYKKGKRLYFRKTDLDKWINNGRRKTLDEINEEADNYIKRRGRYNKY